MVAVLKFFKIIRTNWKKSILFSCAGLYGGSFAKEKYDDSWMRREYCLAAKKFGDMPLKVGERATRVTVFLNPAAQGGKGRKLYEKNAAPILNLAGLEVTVVKTEYEGQAKKYMDILEDTDAVVVAGGNGLLLEVVTGLLRRPDDVAKNIPIGVVPLGRTNTLCRTLVPDRGSEVRWMLDAALAVVYSQRRPCDVMRIQGETGNVFSLSELKWGYFKDAEERKKKNWYFGPLKHWWTYLRTAMTRAWPPVYAATLEYSMPCGGCNRCWTPPPPPPWRWWHILLPPKIAPLSEDFSNVNNPYCGRTRTRTFRGIQLEARTRNHLPYDAADASDDVTDANDASSDATSDVTASHPAIEVEVDETARSRAEYVKEGWRRASENFGWGKSDTVGRGESDDVGGQTKAEVGRSDDGRWRCGGFTLKPSLEEGVEEWYSIDGERFECMDIEVKLLPNKLQFFHLATSS